MTEVMKCWSIRKIFTTFRLTLSLCFNASSYTCRRAKDEKVRWEKSNNAELARACQVSRRSREQPIQHCLAAGQHTSYRREKVRQPEEPVTSSFNFDILQLCAMNRDNRRLFRGISSCKNSRSCAVSQTYILTLVPMLLLIFYCIFPQEKLMSLYRQLVLLESGSRRKFKQGKHGTRHKPYGCLCLTFKSTHARECTAIVSDGLAAYLSRIHTTIIMLIASCWSSDYRQEVTRIWNKLASLMSVSFICEEIHKVTIYLLNSQRFGHSFSGWFFITIASFYMVY